MGSWRVGGYSAVLLVGCAAFSTSGDDSKDAGSGATNDANSACAGQHTVCMNFDHGPPGPPWNIANLGTTATIVSAPEPVFSPPSSLKASIDATTGTGYPLASVPLPASTKHVRCAAQLQVTDVSTIGGATVLRLGTLTGAAYVQLSLEPSDLKLDTSAGGHELPSLQTNRFAEIAVEVSTAGAGYITYSGPGGPVQVPLPAPLADVAFTRADFGLSPNGSASKWTAYFDDIYCDVLP